MDADHGHVLAPSAARPPLSTARLRHLIDAIGEARPRRLASADRVDRRAVAQALDEVRLLFERQQAADERELLDVVGGVLERLAIIDHLVEVLADLNDRVQRLEARPQQT